MTELEILDSVAILMLTHQAVWDLGNDPKFQPLGVLMELQEHEIPSYGITSVGLGKVHRHSEGQQG